MRKKAETIVIEFARIIDKLSISIPYINQSMMPTKNKISIGSDNADTSLVFQVLYTCGRNADVVNTAAISPMISIKSILINIKE